MNLTFIDTETTGILRDDVIIQLGLVNEVGGEIKNSIYSFFGNGSRKISLISKATHGIVEKDIAHFPVFSSETPEYRALDELARKSVFIGHNVQFDINMISKAGIKVDRYIDNLQLAKHLMQEEEDEFENSYRQEVLKYYLMEKGIVFPKAKAHDAMGDVQVAMVIFRYLFDLTRTLYGLNSEDEILNKMLELTKSPIMLLKLNFGKHKGGSFDNIYKNDPCYLDWLYRNSDDDNVRFTCGNYISF